jgi:hypothetical protein
LEVFVLPSHRKSTAAKKLSMRSFQCRHDAPAKNKDYVRLFEDLLSSPAFESLDAHAVAMFVDMSRKYKGQKKGEGDDFIYSFEGNNRGMSKPTFYRCVKLLIEKGFIDCIEYNRYNRKAHIYTFSTRWHQSYFE